MPEAKEPGRGGGAGECEGGALLRDRPLQRQRGLHLHPHDLLRPPRQEEEGEDNKRVED